VTVGYSVDIVGKV